LCNDQFHRRGVNDSYFNYAYSPGGGSYDEPEGLTIWDLDDGRAPGIKGQLHVLLLDNDVIENDDVSLKNYTSTISVDKNHTGKETGKPWEPYNTINEAYNLAAWDDYFLWDGARIKIKAGTYPESIIFSKRIEVMAEGGTVTIGD
jgi:hypothetical protein